MKKFYTLGLLLVTSILLSQSVVITRVVDGTIASDGCSGATGTSSPKITELYVNGTVNFTNYRFQTESNGATSAATIAWSTGLDMTPVGTITNSFVYLIGSGATTFNEMYPTITLPTGLVAGNLPNGNGNDAYRIAIYDAPTAGNLVSVVDQFGNPLDLPINDYTAAWCYQDSFAKRNNNVVANGGNFTTSSFTYGGNGNFNTPNNNCSFISNTIGIGAFTLGIQQNSISGLKVYPNPAKDFLYITSDNNTTKQVEVYDVLGKVVLNTKTTNTPVNVAGLNRGVYVVKITEEGKTATRKLVIE
jgi:Secretion system C-terminal sorting domain